MKCATTPFGKHISVQESRGSDGFMDYWVVLNVPYLPWRLCGRNFASRGEARVAAIHLEAKLNRMVNEHAKRRDKQHERGNRWKK